MSGEHVLKMFSGSDITAENIHVKAHSETPLDVIPDEIMFRHSSVPRIIFTIYSMFLYKNT